MFARRFQLFRQSRRGLSLHFRADHCILGVHHLVIVYLVIRYRRGRQKPEDIHGHLLLELTWTGIPLVLFLSMFYYGWTNYRYLRRGSA